MKVSPVLKKPTLKQVSSSVTPQQPLTKSPTVSPNRHDDEMEHSGEATVDSATDSGSSAVVVPTAMPTKEGSLFTLYIIRCH
jgi:hypothetical protein